MADSSGSTGLVTTIIAILGGLGTWLTGKAFDRYMELRKQRNEERKEKPPFSQDQVFEDRTLQTGYKALMLMLDKRIKELEEREQLKLEQERTLLHRISDLEQEHMDCLEEHSRAKKQNETLAAELAQVRQKHSILERRLARLQKRVDPTDENEDSDSN